MDKRFIAPIVVTILVICYCIFMTIGFVGFAMFEGLSLWGFLLSLFVPVSVASIIIYMLVERIKEIKGGEEDEASKY